jgi:hypothetical protein
VTTSVLADEWVLFLLKTLHRNSAMFGWQKEITLTAIWQDYGFEQQCVT